MDKENKNFLFFNNVEDRFELWELEDQSTMAIENFLKNSYEIDKMEPETEPAINTKFLDKMIKPFEK